MHTISINVLLEGNIGVHYKKSSIYYTGIEFKDFILGFRQSTFLCTTLKCIEKFRISFIKSGIKSRIHGSPLNSQPDYMCSIR